MAAALAFFPWVTIAESVKVGRFRLLPYDARKRPGSQPNITQSDIDGVLRAYSKKPHSAKKQATLLEVGRWYAGQEISPRVLETLFKARQFIGFAALSQRRLFVGYQYTNFDTYSLVVQRFQPRESGTFAFTTRRRDGYTNQLWSSDEFTFHKPNHVDASAVVELDTTLLAALSRLPKKLEHVYEAIREFNSANTDSLDIPEYVEVVLVKSALEWLLGINVTASALQNALRTLLQDIRPVDLPHGTVERLWKKKWKKWNNPRPIEAWARDFCAVRASAAHGKKRNVKGSSVWSASEHLAFASIFFPLLVKKILMDARLFKMGAADLERLRRIDSYLMYDPFARRKRRDRHPWTQIDNFGLRAASSESFHKTMRDAYRKSKRRTF